MPELLIVLLALALVASGFAWWQQRTALRQNKLEITHLQATAAQLQRQFDAREQTIQTQSATRAEAEARLAEIVATSTTLQIVLDSKTRELETLQKQLSDLQETLDNTLQDTDYRQALVTALANSAYDALLLIDLNYRILAVNTVSETLFNNPQPVGQHLTEITGSPELEMMVEDALVNAEEMLEEQLTIREHGYLVSVQIIRYQDQQLIGLALQDITELIRLNRARRDMVANISHELRTPIANIRLIIDGLFHDQDKPRRKDSISSLRAVARETDALLWLVQEMADLSMIESGQAIVRMVEVPLSEIISEAVERLTDQIASKHLKIIRQIPTNLRVLCDRDLIQRVTVNLLHNAKKWSPEGEVITISAEAASDEIIISINDRGPGVPDDQVERIFERFYQVDASRSGSEGTGLGLAICRHIVGAHGGRIWAEGKSQGGGRFKFTLLSADPAVETQTYLSSGTLNGTG